MYNKPSEELGFFVTIFIEGIHTMSNKVPHINNKIHIFILPTSTPEEVKKFKRQVKKAIKKNGIGKVFTQGAVEYLCIDIL